MFRHLALTGVVLALGTATADEGRKSLPRLFESAAATAANATVRVQVEGKDTILGTVVSKDGFILTKGSELIGKEGKLKTTISCVFRDGLAFDAAVLGYHRPSDLMLLKVEAESLTSVKFAPASKAEPGNFVAAPAVVAESIEPAAVGIISAPSRVLSFPEDTIENANRGFLGIVFEASRDLKNTRIAEVKNAAANKAGLKKGDAIVAANDRPVKERTDLFAIMDDTTPGDMMSLKVKRKNKDGEDEELTFKFKLIDLPQMDRGAMQNVMGGYKLSSRRGGFPKVIQHDTVLSPNQVGGPLVDLEGNILGLNIARAGRVETWALPADVLEAVYKDLKDGKHPYPPKSVPVTVDKKNDPQKEPKK
jgi:serine protease Do